MDKIREEFEAWCTGKHGKTSTAYYQGAYKFWDVQSLWDAWQASRAALVVELPQLVGDGENDTEYDEGYNSGIIHTSGYIRRSGITIKGEEK